MRRLPCTIFLVRFALLAFLAGCAAPSDTKVPTTGSEASSIRVVRLEHTRADEIAEVVRQTLRKRLAEHPAAKGTTEETSTVNAAHADTNSPVVSAPAATMNEVLELIAELDRG